VLIVSGRLGPEVFAEVINAGADMYLTKPVTFEQVELAVRAVHRRIMTTARTATAWKLDSRRSLLTAPDGQSVELGATDLMLMECFCRPRAKPSAATISAACWPIPAQPSPTTTCTPPSTACAAASKATPVAVPLQSQQKVGYQFRAPLIAA
jgi:DNA-binding response OmpR family regulator